MIILRPLFLFICDIILGLFTKLRKLASLSPGDLQLAVKGELLAAEFYPYDLVTSKENSKNVDIVDEVPEIGNLYAVGMVVGYKGTSAAGYPKFVKVAYFNTGEPNVPNLKLHSPDDLVLVYPTLQSVRFANQLAREMEQAAITHNIGDLFNKDTSDTDEGGDDGSGNNSGGNIIH